MGRVIETSVTRSTDPAVVARATDGSVVTALLLHLFNRGRIEGAIVARQVGPFQRAPFLATSKEDILAAAGFYFDTSHGMKQFSDQYMTFAPIEEVDPMVKKGLNRVALVGTPCQILSVRRMQAMELVPSDAIKLCLGLFCLGNFVFGEHQRAQLAEMGDFDWQQVDKVNIKETLQLHLKDGGSRCIELEDMNDMRRYACQYCAHYAAEFADIAFGGIGAAEGWTTVITRTPLSRAVMADAKGAGVLAGFNYAENPNYVSDALGKVREASARKKKTARHSRRELHQKPVTFRE